MDAHHLEQAIAGTSKANAVLLASVRDGLQVRLSTPIITDPHKIVYPEYHVERPIPSDVLEYLHLILRGIYRAMLCEWIMRVYLSAYQPQREVVQVLLDMLVDGAPNYPQWAHAFRQLLGEKQIASALNLLKAGQHPVDKVKSVTQWFSLPPYRLKKTQWIWTDAMTDKFILRVRGRFGWNGNNSDYINENARFFGLDVASRALETLIYSNNYAVDMRKEQLKQATSVVEFRQRMVQTIQAGV